MNKDHHMGEQSRQNLEVVLSYEDYAREFLAQTEGSVVVKTTVEVESVPVAAAPVEAA